MEAVRRARAAVVLQKNWRRATAVKAYRQAILCGRAPDAGPSGPAVHCDVAACFCEVYCRRAWWVW